jgi:hypothetical protein
MKQLEVENKVHSLLKQCDTFNNLKGMFEDIYKELTTSEPFEFSKCTLDDKIVKHTYNVSLGMSNDGHYYDYEVVIKKLGNGYVIDSITFL